MNIGVIDSGIGGLTVLFDIVERFPNCNYYYLGDSKNCPYGKKSEEQIKEFSYKIVKYLCNNKNINLLVIACNSISSVASEYLKEKFKNLIIIETVIPTSLYVKELNSKKLGLIATNATIKSKMYEKYLKEYKIYSKACPIFVDIVENINITKKEKDEIVKNELKDIINKNIDTLILGCTHYPLLVDSIEKVFKGNIVTSSKAIILELEKYIKNNKIKGSVKIYTTGDEKIFKNQIKTMFNKNYEVEKVEIR